MGVLKYVNLLKSRSSRQPNGMSPTTSFFAQLNSLTVLTDLVNTYFKEIFLQKSFIFLKEVSYDKNIKFYPKFQV